MWGKVYNFHTFTFAYCILLKFKVLMIPILGNIEAKIDARGGSLYRQLSGRYFNLLPNYIDTQKDLFSGLPRALSRRSMGRELRRMRSTF